jgi:UDP-glucose 4-epimerase
VPVVAITGVSSGLGAQLLAQVLCDPEVTRVVALGPTPPPELAHPAIAGDPERVVFVRRGSSEPWEDVFVRNGVDTAIHVALTDPLRDRALEEAATLGTTRRFLEACHAVDAPVVCVVTSAAAYGAHADNADYLFEGAALRPNPGLPHAVDAARAEALCYEYAGRHPEVCLTLVRTCPVIGPGAGGFWVRLLERPWYLAPAGHEPVLQLVHEDDATRAVWRLVKQRRIGVFNVAGDGYVTLTQAARVLDRRVVRVPVLLFRLLVWLAWRLLGSEVPPGMVPFFLHPWLVNPTKVKTDALFMFRYDSPRALLDWVEARDAAAHGAAPIFAAPDDEVEDLDDEVLEEDELEPELEPELVSADEAGAGAAPPDEPRLDPAPAPDEGGER